MGRLDELIAIHAYREPRTMNPTQLDAWERSIPIPGILHAIEMKVADDFATGDALRDYLVDVCAYVQWPTGRDVRDLPEIEAEHATRLGERESFRASIGALTEPEIQQMPPVPMRRILRVEERRSILRRVVRAWPSGQDRWHPLTAVLRASEHLALQSAWVGADELPVEPMRMTLAQLASGRHIWQLHEGGPHGWTEDVRAYVGSVEGQVALVRIPMWTGFELDVASWWAPPLGSETLWVSSKFDWLLYAHHEAVLYVAGAPLIRQMHVIWPGCHTRVWTGPAYIGPDPRPPRHYLP